MIWLIAKKDFLLNLLSVRFVIGFMLCLLVIPFTLVIGVDGYLNQVRVYKVDKENADNQWKGVREYSFVRPLIVKEPSPLSIFSKGINENVGKEKKINLGEVPLFLDGQTSSGRDNPFLNTFFSIDFATVVAILISLLALVFSYDSVTREREDGTMKLTFTGKVGRITFLFGKLAGLLLTLLPILLFCYLLACLIVVLNPEITFSITDWQGIILLFITSVLYMMVFILLGMMISSLTRNSSTSIIVSLLCWIWFLFLVPSISFYLSQSLIKVTMYDNVKSGMQEIESGVWNEYEGKWDEIRKELCPNGVSYYNYNGGGDGMQSIYGGGQNMVEATRRGNAIREPMRIDAADKKWALQKNYQDELLFQNRVRQYLSWISPSELFKQATQKLCRTDADSYLRYMETIRNYREVLIRYMMDKKLFESITYFTAMPLEAFATVEEIKNIDVFNYDNQKWNRNAYEPLNLDDVPVYVPAEVSLSVTLGEALGRMVSLLALSVVLLMVTIAVFMKYDVR